MASLSFLDGTYNQGLGEFRLLATTGDVTPTETYVNSLGIPLVCMTDYSTFEDHIDRGYWPASVTPARLPALYCRQPVLDTGSKDYGVYRTGNDGVNDFQVYALRVRELGSLTLNLNEQVGAATVEFSRNTILARALYYMADDFNTNRMTVGEVSRLPDGLSTNSFHVEWNRPGGHYAYALSEPISMIDLYTGPHETMSQTNGFTKVVLRNVPASASLDYVFGNRVGHADFVASSPWEAGVLVQDGGTRYVGWLALQSLHFDYSFALPGEESCSLGGFDIGFCYRIFRFDSHLEALSTTADGILGIYDRSGSLSPLSDSTAPRSTEYIPEWMFTLDNFSKITAHALWDVGIGITIANGSASAAISLFPTVTVVLGANLDIDFFWNSQVVWNPSVFHFPFPVPLCIETDIGVNFTINTVKDYVDQNPIHLWPNTGASPIVWTGPSLVSSGGPNPICGDWHLTLTAAIDVPGFHRFPDHGVPF